VSCKKRRVRAREENTREINETLFLFISRRTTHGKSLLLHVNNIKIMLFVVSGVWNLSVSSFVRGYAPYKKRKEASRVVAPVFDTITVSQAARLFVTVYRCTKPNVKLGFFSFLVAVERELYRSAVTERKKGNGEKFGKNICCKSRAAKRPLSICRVNP
jgi:hypothetical protein